MSHMYWFKKDHSCYDSVLTDMLMLSTIASKFDHVAVKYDSEKSLMSIIEIHMKEVLLSDDEDVLNNIINTYSPTCEMQVRYNLEMDLINPAMSYGREIIAKFGANNVYKQKNNEQIDSLVESMPVLITALETGSLQKAYREFISMQPSENISQSELDEFRTRVGWFLGITE